MPSPPALAGCAKRPQQAKRRIVLAQYGEALSAARTPLADFFRSLLQMVIACGLGLVQDILDAHGSPARRHRPIYRRI